MEKVPENWNEKGSWKLKQNGKGSWKHKQNEKGSWKLILNEEMVPENWN